MTREERVVYLGNVVHVAGVDGEVSPREGEAIEQVRRELGAQEDELAAALRAVARGEHNLAVVGRLSERIRNLEDMLFVAVCDRRFSGEERPEVMGFAREVGVSQAQLNTVVKEAKERLSSGVSTGNCPSCGKPVPSESKFCPGCGRDLRGAAA